MTINIKIVTDVSVTLINECLTFITQYGQTALIIAVIEDHTTICELLVDRGANLNLQDEVTTHHIHMSKGK